VRAADVRRFLRGRRVGEIKAEIPECLTMNRGQGCFDHDGATMPAGADAVVMVEYTSAQEVGAREFSILKLVFLRSSAPSRRLHSL